jgi:uncharacterized low-complexity protein
MKRFLLLFATLLLAASATAQVDLKTNTKGKLPLDKGGTNATSFSAGKCVRVANDGSKLESAANDCGTGSGTAAKRQSPAESCDGIRTTFTFSSTVPADPDTYQFFWNGLVQTAVDDFTASGSTVTLIRPCKSGDHLFAYF